MHTFLFLLRKYSGLFLLMGMMMNGGDVVGQIASNPITGTNPSTSNPYTIGQTVVANLTFSGIGRGSGIASAAADNRYNASGWNSGSLDSNDYFEFILTPATGYKIDFTSFVYIGQRSGTGPTSFAFRSSIDNYTANLGIPTAAGTTINLSEISFQNITTAVTFRLYGWSASAGGGTFSVNDFAFTGTVTPTGFTVTFDNNNGTGTMPNQTASSATNLTTNTFTRTGYTFTGWNTLANGLGTPYSNGASFPFTENTTLYAQWSPNFNITFANLQFPAAGTINEGANYDVYGQVYAAGLTEGAGPGAGITAEFGYNTSNNNPNAWTNWQPATFNTQLGNNDEYVATFSGLAIGTYYYATRFRYGSEPWVYGGYKNNDPSPTAGGIWDGTNNISGVLTVISNVVDFANLELPYSGTITEGADFISFAKVYKAGLTEPAGASASINAWIGISTTNATTTADFNNPAWTWIPAAWDSQPVASNDDIYKANIAGPSRPAGVYYYVSRFSINGSTEFRYGGTNNAFWSSSSHSGELTINKPTITITPTTLTGFTYVYGSGPSAPQQSFLVSGSNLTANITLTAPSNYEMSLTSGSGYTTTPIVLTQMGGSVASTPIFVRLRAGRVVANYNENITATSSLATDATVALTGTVTPKALTISAPTIASKVYDGLINTGTITPGTLSGLIGTETLNVTASGTFADADAGTGKTATVVYVLANGSNGGLANNYTLANGTGTGDITKANPVITPASITVNIGGTYVLPGTAFTTNSNGTVTYTITSNGFATLSGTTITGVATGSETLTVNQAASTNYNVGSTSVTVNVTTVIYVNGDYRTIGNGNWHGTASSGSINTWEQLVGTTWTSVSNSPPSNLASLGTRTVFIRHNISLIGNNTAPRVVVENGGTLSTSTVSATFGNLLVKGGGVFNREGNGSGISGIFEVENEGTFTFRHTNNTSRSSSIWAGTERFHANSNFEVVTVDNTAMTVVQNIGDVSLFTDPITNTTACFGNVIINCSAGKMNFVYDGFNSQLTHNDLIFRTNSDTTPFSAGNIVTTIGRNFIIENSYNQTTANIMSSAATANIIVKGNFQHLDNTNFRLTTNIAANSTFLIEGDMIINGTGTFNMNGGTGAITGTSVVNLKGDLIVANGNSILSTATGSNLFNFNGTGDGLTDATTQTINVVNQATASNITFNVQGGSYTKIINQDFTLGTNSKFNVLAGGVMDFGFNGNTALNIKGNGITGTGFSAVAGSYLKITSPQGVSASSGTVGNVQTNTAPVYTQPLTYHYIGKVDQSTGTGIGNTSSGKAVIVELANNNLQLNLSHAFGITNAINANINNGLGGILDLKIGKIIEDEVNYITGSTGGLSMADGTFYSIAKNSATSSDVIPRLQGLSNSYSLLGSSTIALNGNNGSDAFDQYLRGGRAYRNLTFSNAGTKILSSSVTSVTGTIVISDAAIVDVENKSLGGSGTNFTMSGTSEYRTAGTGTKPDATGTYSLGMGTKVSFTNGSLALPVATLQEIRLAPTYYNIDIEGNNVGTDTETGIKIQSGGTFNVKPTGVFKFTNTAGFSGQTGTAVANTNAPTILLSTESTVEYAKSGDQIITAQTNIVEITADLGDDDSHYSSLKLSGSGTKSISGTVLKVGNNLDVDVEGDALLPVLGTQSLIVNKNITTVNANTVVNNAPNTSVDATKGILIKDGGSLVQIENPATNDNSGNIQMERISKLLYRFDYTYWSSPVQDFILKSVSPTTLFDKFFSWKHDTQNWFLHSMPANNLYAMENGRGYIVRAPQSYDIEGSTDATAETYTANFVGVPNNGTVTMEVTGQPDPDPIPPTPSYKWNLLGNPYPSAIDGQTFLNVNNNLGGTLYFWTHNTSISGSTPNYSPNDYASWNGTGGTGTTASAPSSVEPGAVNGALPTGKIAAGQGFFVKGLASGPVIFNNTMRVKEAGQNNQFFKSSEYTENTTPSEKHRVWLNMKGTPKGFNQLLVGYVTNATNDFDNRYDGESFGGNLVTFYSINNTKNLVIQGRALPFVNTDTVPLGYKTTLTGNLIISIDHVDGGMVGQDIYLQDNVLNVVHDLTASNYVFATVPGTFNNRFVLRYLPQEVLSNPTFDEKIKSVIIYKNGCTLHVNSPYESIATVAVYDLTGRLIFERKNCNTTRFETNELLSVDQALIVKVTLVNGAVVSEKVL